MRTVTPTHPNLRRHLATEMAVAIVAVAILALNASHTKWIQLADYSELLGGGGRWVPGWETVAGWPFDAEAGYSAWGNAIAGILLLLGTGLGFHRWHRTQSVSGTALAAGEAAPSSKLQFGLKEILFATLCFAIFFFLCRPHIGAPFSEYPRDLSRAFFLLPVSFAIGSCGYAIVAWLLGKLRPASAHRSAPKRTSS